MFKGDISFPSVYNRALSEKQVRQLYNGGSPRPYEFLSDSLKTDLVGFWNLANWQDSQDSALSDLSDSGNNLSDKGSLSFSDSGLRVDQSIGSNTGNYTMSFDGVDDFLEISDQNLVTSGLGKVYFSAWVKFNSVSSTQRIYSENTSGSGTQTFQ